MTLCDLVLPFYYSFKLFYKRFFYSARDDEDLSRMSRLLHPLQGKNRKDSARLFTYFFLIVFITKKHRINRVEPSTLIYVGFLTSL